MKIFHLAAAGAIALAFISCEPQYYLLNMEKRGASSSGVNLLGKNISLVYVADEETEVFSNAVATGFAQTLEKELSSGEETIGIFSVPPGGENYGSRDSLVKFLIETGDDVIMLLDRPRFSGHKIVTNRPVVDLGISADSSYLAEGSASFSLKMYYYDSMGKEDEVRSFSGTNTIHPTFFNPGDLPEEEMISLMMAHSDVSAFQVGAAAARTFKPEWKAVGYTLYYYESFKWEDALELAYQMKWNEALDKWLSLASASRNTQKRAAAEFNIATACHILGNNALAIEWLDRSDADCMMHGSASLRKKILAEM